MGTGRGAIILDDDFVLEQLRDAERLPGFLAGRIPPNTTSQGIEDTREKCLRLFDQHRGIVGAANEPKSLREERQLLNHSFTLVGDVLHLEHSLPIFESIVQTDWKAHVELEKEKRYRDHITHPARVTAIGWWLLHRDDGRLLKKLGTHCQGMAGTYGQRLTLNCPHTWERMIEYAWVACGLLHDSAYPLEYHLRAGAKLCQSYADSLGVLGYPVKAFSSPPKRQKLLKPLAGTWFLQQPLQLDRRLAEMCGDQAEKRFKHAHALLGALHHLLLLGDQIHTAQGLVVQLAARAIVTHHDDDKGQIVSDPLAFLLYVSDNLQSWNRPFLYHESPAGPGDDIRIRRIVECHSIRLAPDGKGRLRVEFQMNARRDDMEILKNHYNWAFDKFLEPNRELERLIQRHGGRMFPPIILSEERCIQPGKFTKFMS